MPGMAHANITIQDFSAENNSFVFNKAELINEVTTAVLEQLSNKKAFAENLKEGGNQTMDKFNELLEKYGKTVEDITFEYENLTDEELESAFANAFEISKNSSSEEADFEEEESPVNTEKFDGSESTDESTSGSDGGSDEGSTEGSDGGSDEGSDGGSDEGSDDESDDEHQSTSAIEDEDSTGTRVENSLEYSVTVNGVTKNFSVSLRDKINAVATLVNDTYSDLDNAWYDVDVYEDDGKYCVMHDWWNDKHFKQEYTVKKDVYSLKGDRVKVTMQFLTDDQIAQLDKMKSDFAVIESELNSYKSKELHSAREAVLSSEDYSMMADFEEFKDLKEHMDDYSIDELTNKADLVYAKFMKSNYSNFSASNGTKKHSVVFMTSGDNKEEERLPYGGLFKNFKGNK